MEIWQELREQYARGGVTHKELSERYGVPLNALRRRAAEEKWSELRKQHGAAGTGEEMPAARLRLEKQLAVTDRMLDVFMRALERDAEFYTYIELQKVSGGAEYISSQMEIINIDRAAKLIKAVGDIFELQRAALGLHEYKDELSARKIEQDGDIAHRKLELERLKLEGLCDAGVPDDGFLEALGGAASEAAGDADE